MRIALKIALGEIALGAIFLVLVVAATHAAPPPSQAAADIGAWKGIEAARCYHFRPIHHVPTYLCVVKVRSGCVAGLYQYRRGQGIGWFSQSLRPVKCWKTDGGPTS